LLCSSFALFKTSSAIADEERHIKNGKKSAEEEEGKMMAERCIYVPENEEGTERTLFLFFPSIAMPGLHLEWLILASWRTNLAENIANKTGNLFVIQKTKYC
jgi:hypothetical protein